MSKMTKTIALHLNHYPIISLSCRVELLLANISNLKLAAGTFKLFFFYIFFSLTSSLENKIKINEKGSVNVIVSTEEVK